MQIIPLQNIPNQAFSVVLNGVDYRVALRTIQGMTFMSVWVGGEVLFYNQLCTPNNWVNVYDYISVNGKFYFRCLEEEYPTYTQFGITQSLIFYNAEEVEEIKNAKA